MQPVGVTARARDWIRYWWVKVPEPRLLSILWGSVYAFMLGAGALALAWPPVSLLAEAGRLTMVLVGVLLVVGAVIGILGGSWGSWQLERVGIGCMLAGLAGYALTVLGLHVTADGNRLPQLALQIALMLCLGARLAMIWRFSYLPKG